MAEQARSGGATALLLYPPRWLAQLPGASDRVLGYHAAVAAVGLPVLAFYLYEAAGGVSYEPSQLEAILSIDNVVGIKIATLDSIMTFQDIVLTLVGRDTLVLTGEDRFLGYSLTIGATSALVGIAAAATDKCVSLVDSWIARDLPTFYAASAAMDAFSMATFRAPMEGYVQRMLWAAQADGVFERTPFDRAAPPMPKSEHSMVNAALARLRGR
jgi:4-hydroxy-tetrahydrodipicolinate synthase